MALSESQAYLLDIRRTRVARPARAAEDPGRAALYGAALEQFEELLTAARHVGYASRPIPLFYALSQAGRSIVAAYGEEPTVDGHGLKEKRVQSGSPRLLDRQIERASRRDGLDAFGSVAAALGSPAMAGAASLGAIWAATPEASRFLMCDWSATWYPPLPTTVGTKDGHVAMSAYQDQDPHRQLEPGDLQAAHYPTLPPEGQATLDWGFDDHLARQRACVGTVYWTPDEAPEDSLRGRLARTRLPGHDDALLVPAVNEGSGAMHPLLSWWALLFALSIFSRYHPTLWISELNIDQSDSAVSLQALLDVAVDEVPALVYEALVREEPEPIRVRDSPWTRITPEQRAEYDEAVRNRPQRRPQPREIWTT